MEKNIASQVIRKYGLVISLSLVMLLSVVDIFFVSVSKPKIEQANLASEVRMCSSSEAEKVENITSISEISGPSVGNEAATSTCQTLKASNCGNIDSKVWVFLLISYIALLIFNLKYGSISSRKIQWKWETIMTGIFIFGWFYFDKCAQNLWFPLYVTKIGLAIYTIYLYFVFKTKNEEKIN